MSVQNSTEVRVWDPFIRVAHWTIAIAFFVAYLTEDDLMTVHVWAATSLVSWFCCASSGDFLVLAMLASLISSAGRSPRSPISGISFCSVPNATWGIVRPGEQWSSRSCFFSRRPWHQASPSTPRSAERDRWRRSLRKRLQHRPRPRMRPSRPSAKRANGACDARAPSRKFTRCLRT